MEENYSQELYDWISTTDNTFAEREPFEEWSIKVGEDAAYAQELYDWISSVDNTFAEREPFEEWSIKVKKKRQFSTYWGRGSYGIRYRRGGTTWLIGAFRNKS